MKLRSPLFVLFVAFMALIAVAISAHADTNIVGTGPAPVILPAATQDVYFHVGALNFNVPWDNVNAVYLFDLPSKTNLVGGEAVFATIWRIQATGGAVTSLNGVGNPFVGGNLWFQNPIPQLAILNTIKPGVFGGWNFTDHVAMFGFKASIPIFN